MFENRPFHGYNERSVQPFLYKMLPLTFLHCGFFVVLVRSLSKESALELAADIKKSYHGNGQESICLMFQRPASTYADVIHEVDNPEQPLQCENKHQHTAVELVRCFAGRHYRNKAFVPKMFIPCCGQVCTRCWFVPKMFIPCCGEVYLLLLCHLQHRSYAYETLYQELRHNGFITRVVPRFTITVYDCMPKQVSCLISKVRFPLFGTVTQPLLNSVPLIRSKDSHPKFCTFHSEQNFNS